MSNADYVKMECGKVENPTTDIKSFNLGDFVFFLHYDKEPAVGIVTSTVGDNIQFTHFPVGKL